MGNERYSIIFSSRTGNTEMLARTIRDALGQGACERFGRAEDGDVPSSRLLFVGFWTDRGIADAAAIELLEELRGRRIFLFGTAGFGGSGAYFDGILQKTRAHIDASNTVVGEFMCQGRMPQSVRERYVKMKAQPDCAPNIDAMIENFDAAATHPDEGDLEKLKLAVAQVL